MKKVSQFLMCLLGVGILASCNKNETESNDDTQATHSSTVVAATEYDEWTYFDFETNKSTTVKIEKQEVGGFSGTFTTNYAMIVGGQPSGSQEEVTIVISDDTSTSDLIAEINITNISVSMGAPVAEPYTLTSKANITKEGDKWILTGIDSECEASGSTWKTNFTAEISMNEGGDIKITGTATPGNMPMPISVSCDGTVGKTAYYQMAQDENSFDWDIAFHKYDIRTNGCEAVKTTAEKLDQITTIPASGFEADTENRKVMADMSQMMQGFVGYHYTTINPVLNAWLTATPTGTMPPYTYELNEEVIVVKTSDNKYYKVKFTDYSNEKDITVYAAFDYEEIK